MNTENKVTSLKLAKKIHDKAKEKGFELPESEYMWVETNQVSDDWEQELLSREEAYDLDVERRNEYPALDTSELGGMLPGNIDGNVFQTQKGMLGNIYYCMMVGIDNKMDREAKHQEEEKTMAEAMGQMYFYLLSNDLL